jgi:hypothetical protein
MPCMALEVVTAYRSLTVESEDLGYFASIGFEQLSDGGGGTGRNVAEREEREERWALSQWQQLILWCHTRRKG